MASAAQITANRLNAQHSTGPRTPEGKRVASLNSLKTGFCSSVLVIPEQLRPVFDEFRAGLLKSTAPQTAIEDLYFRRLLLHGWNLLRIQDLETQAVFEGVEGARLELYARYRRDLERGFDRALRTLRQLQSERVARASAGAEMHAALDAEAPLATPPPARPISSAELTEILDAVTTPQIQRSEPYLPRCSNTASSVK